MELEVIELCDPRDPRVCDWLDIFQRQFPPHEQVSASTVLRILQQKCEGGAAGQHLLLATREEEAAAIAWVDEEFGADGAALWYLAVAPGQEGRGTGTRLMQHIRDLVFGPRRFLVMEVERPDTHPHPASEEDRAADLCRIEQRDRFYQERFGAYRLTGVRYLQQVGWSEPVPMDLLLLFHPKHGPLSPEETFQRLLLYFEENIRQVGPLALQGAD